MAFLTRWDDDQSRPTLKEAGRDLAVRVLLPLTVWWLVVLAISEVPLSSVMSELEKRTGRSGLAEKRSRATD